MDVGTSMQRTIVADRSSVAASLRSLAQDDEQAESEN
jgi:hypothetical protein